MTKILFEVKKYGRYLHHFPVKRATIGYKLTGKVYSQFIQIILSSDGIMIFDNKHNLLKNIPYNAIKEYKEINVAEKLKMKKSSWDYFWNDYNVIFIDDGKEETFLLFWSNVAGWQKKLHKKVFKIIEDQIKKTPSNLRNQLLKIAKDYEDNVIPISRIKDEFGLDYIDTYRKIGELKDPDYEFELSQKAVRIKEKSHTTVEKENIITINEKKTEKEE
ncbi:MAG: hypothetical protein ACTSO9_20510 [Candidatus Helarchaeota archaeon]